jgi:3-oxoacyl-[acyl-carrier protein] reductase
VKKDRHTGEVTVLPKEQWDAVLAVNLTGATCWSARRCGRWSRPARARVVVSMSSIARHGNRGQSNYVAAKAALAANTFTWAREFAPSGSGRPRWRRG